MKENKGPKIILIHTFRKPIFQLMLGLIFFVRKMLLRCRFHWHDRGPLFISPYDAMVPFQRWLWFYFPKTICVSRWEEQDHRPCLTVSWWSFTLGDFHFESAKTQWINLSKSMNVSLVPCLSVFFADFLWNIVRLNYPDTYPL